MCKFLDVLQLAMKNACNYIMTCQLLSNFQQVIINSQKPTFFSSDSLLAHHTFIMYTFVVESSSYMSVA